MPYSLCGSSVANLGEQQCDKSRGVIKKLFIFNGSIAAADYADPASFLAKMVEYSKLPKSSANKVFVLNEIQDIADNAEADKEGSLNQGFKATLVEGKPGYKIKTFGGSDLTKRLRMWNNQNIKIIEYDANGVFWVVEKSSRAYGFSAKIFSKGNKAATGQNVEEGVIDTTVGFLSTSEYYDNAKWVETVEGGNVEDIVSLLDVKMTYVSKSTNVYKIKLEVPGSNLVGPYNIFESDGGVTVAAVAALSASFSAGSGTGYGTSLPITSIAADNTLKALTVTFDSTAFGLLSSGAKFLFTPPTPVQLDGGNVLETELLSVVLTK